MFGGVGSPCLEKSEGMLDNIKYFSSFVCERDQTINVTSRIELGSMSKTRNSPITVKYKEILSNSCSYAEMGNSLFFISTDV